MVCILRPDGSQSGFAIFSVFFLLAAVSLVLNTSNALSCNGGEVSSSTILGAGSHTIVNCEISAAVTIEDEAVLLITDSSTTSTGTLSVESGAKVTIRNITLVSTLNVFGGDINITYSLVKEGGRILGTGSGSSTLGVYLTVFASTVVVTNQISGTHSGGLHYWLFSSNQFVGSGFIYFSSSNIARLTFTYNDFSGMYRAPGTVVPAISFATMGMPNVGFVGGATWVISDNIASASGTVDVTTEGGIGLIDMGSTTTSFMFYIFAASFESNLGFAQLVTGGSTFTASSSCSTSLYFRSNDAVVLNVPDSFSVFNFQDMTLTGCPMEITGNTYVIQHTNAASPANAVIAFVSIPSQSSSSNAMRFKIEGNTFSLASSGVVSSTFVEMVLYPSVLTYRSSLLISQNHVTIKNSGGGSVSVASLDGTATINAAHDLTANVVTLASSASATVSAILAIGDAKMKLDSDSSFISLSDNSIALVISTPSTEASLSLLSGNYFELSSSASSLAITGNTLTMGYQPSNPLLDFGNGIRYTLGSLYITRNTINGCDDGDDALLLRVLPTSGNSGTGDSSTTVGCWNTLCMLPVLTLAPEIPSWDWGDCDEDGWVVVIASATLTLPHQEQPPRTQTRPLNNTMTFVHDESSRSRTKSLHNTAAEEDERTPKEGETTTTLAPATSETVSTAAGVVTVFGSFGAVDSASTIQLTALLVIMACRTGGGDMSSARAVITPLHLYQTPAADLLGSALLLVSICAVYYGVCLLIFWAVHRWGPKMGDTYTREIGDGTVAVERVHTEESAERQQSRRLVKAKTFLFYPRMPVLVATLLFPGIVLESSSLLYGELSTEAATWEKFCGVLGLVGSLSFIAYEHTASFFAGQYVGFAPSALVNPHTVYDHGDGVISEDTPATSAWGSAAPASSVGPGAAARFTLSMSRSHKYKVLDNFDRSAAVADEEREDSTVLPSPPPPLPPRPSMATFHYEPSNVTTLAPPPSNKVVTNSSLSKGSIVFEASPSSPPLAPGLVSSVNNGNSVVSGSSLQLVRHSLLGSMGPRRSVLLGRQTRGSHSSSSVVSFSSHHDMFGGVLSHSTGGEGDEFELAEFIAIDQASTAGSSQQRAEGGAAIATGSNDDENKLMLAVRDNDDEDLDDANKPATMRIWFVQYDEMDLAYAPCLLRLTLLAEGYWNTFVSQSLYCVVTPSRPATTWMAAHNLWRMLLVSMVAAIAPSNLDNCKYVQGVIIAVCLVHGMSIMVVRVFRIPILNIFQGTQSILLGLLACTPFIANTTSQAAFGNALVIVSIVAVVLSLAAILLELRIQRRPKTTPTRSAAVAAH